MNREGGCWSDSVLSLLDIRLVGVQVPQQISYAHRERNSFYRSTGLFFF